MKKLFLIMLVTVSSISLYGQKRVINQTIHGLKLFYQAFCHNEYIDPITAQVLLNDYARYYDQIRRHNCEHKFFYDFFEEYIRVYIARYLLIIPENLKTILSF